MERRGYNFPELADTFDEPPNMNGGLENAAP